MNSDRPGPEHEWVRQRMSDQKRAGTAPEMLLRRALFARGLRYRVGYKVPGVPRRTIDIAFPGKRVAVFVDGCFWHGCPQHCVPPKNNAAWWAAKLQRNQERDRETDDVLHAAGWTSLRFWEHQPVMEAVDLTCRTLNLPESCTPVLNSCPDGHPAR